MAAELGFDPGVDTVSTNPSIWRGLEVENMSEVRQTQDPYTRLQESVEDNDLCADWKGVDGWVQELRETYQSLASDESLSDKGRRQKAEEAYDR